MVDSQSSRIALGRYDPFRRTPSLEISQGKIRFLPGRGTHGEFGATEAVFAPGSWLEYRIQKGDMYFDGDRSQTLEKTLWVVESSGSRKLLASGFVLYINFIVATRNLEKRGIRLRAVSFYEGTKGEHIETELSTSPSRLLRPAWLLIAWSNLWLGLLAGYLVHAVGYIVGIGVLGFAMLAITAMRSAASRRAAFVTIISSLPSYAAGYAVVVLIVRFAMHGTVGR